MYTYDWLCMKSALISRIFLKLSFKQALLNTQKLCPNPLSPTVTLPISGDAIMHIDWYVRDNLVTI